MIKWIVCGVDEDITKGKDHEALEGPMTRGRLKQAQHVIETRVVICIAAIDDDWRPKWRKMKAQRQRHYQDY